jgi:hypothetical protein
MSGSALEDYTMHTIPYVERRTLGAEVDGICRIEDGG